MSKTEAEQLKKLKSRIESGEAANQKCWSFIREMNSCSEEQLDSVALHDGYRKYTYRQMFRYWEKYAEAFTAAHITGENHSRVGLIGVQQTETILAFYGLNMTGASVSVIYHLDLYDEKRIRAMIEKEKITDLLISEVCAFPNVMKRLMRDRELLGLRNIILLESPMGGEYSIPMLDTIRKLNTLMFRELSGGLLMADLLKDHEAEPIYYGNSDPSESSIILHTTGTVSGIHKPVPLSDRALNSFVLSAIKAKEMLPDFKAAPRHMVTCMGMNMSWVYCMVDMLHTPLGLGMEVVTLPLGVTNPHYARAIEEFGINILFTSMAMLDTWNKGMPDMDLSRVKLVFMGGTYVSPEFRKSFNNYLRSCGSPARIINGYGLSELGGACIVSPSDREDDAIGFPLPGFKVKIYSEDEDKYYNLEDGPRTGVLHISSPTMSSGRLDDTVIFELTNIDGEDYFNSNDLVRVNEDGSMTCIGRSNQFFVNNAGIRFDAGLIENAVTSQPGIAACGIAPEFHKILHDNVPILYVETTNKGDELGTVRRALIQVFIQDGKIADTNLPSQCVLVESIPLNSGGKVDIRRLGATGVDGRRFDVKPVRLNGSVEDILLFPAPKGEAATINAGVPEELEDDPYNILSAIFAAIPRIKDGGISEVLSVPGMRDMVMKLTDFDIDNVPGSMNRLVPKLMRLSRNLPLSSLSGDFKWNDLQDMFKAFLPVFPEMELPLFPDLDVPILPVPMPVVPILPPLPPVIPLLTLAPLPFWGWGGRRSGKSTRRKEQPRTTSSDDADSEDASDDD